MTDALFRPIGHQLVRQWLTRLAASQRANGGYLFTGPEGIGKSAVALEFAAALRCDAPVGDWSCGTCGECTRIARGVHPSVRRFARPADKSAFPVELVREIVDEASRKRLEPGMRTFIISDADRFNESSANAFLKTLEEPPADLVFVLLAENLAQILPTILSRCQVVRFKPLQDAQVREVSAGWEGLPLNHDVREILIRAAQGSPGRLRRLADAAVMDTVREFLKSVQRDPFHASDKLIEAVQGADDNEARRAHLREIIALLSGTLRDRMLGSLGAANLPPMTRAFEDEAHNTDDLVACLQRLDDLRERVDGNVNLKLCCDAIALAWPA
jgi:DNA polymerase III subunit delta'